MKKRIWLVLLLQATFLLSIGQTDVTYQIPPQALVDLVDAPVTPRTSFSDDLNYMAILERPSNPSIADLASDELRIAGMRIDPATNGSSRISYSTGIQIQNLKSNTIGDISGLPDDLKLVNLSWSPDSRYIAFTNLEENGISLWIITVEEGSCERIFSGFINDVFFRSVAWMPDSQSLLFMSILDDRDAPPAPSKKPSGPVVQENMAKKAAVRTYQDLLENPYDEQLFEYYATSQLMKYQMTGSARPFGAPGIFTGMNPSPDGQYIMVEHIHRPFSYLVPYYRFPTSVEIWDSEGQLIKKLIDIPLIEDIPQGFDAVQSGPRNHSWRADTPATIVWVEAMDGGDPKKETDIRDQVYFLDAPFGGNPMKSVTTKYRFGGITWGKDDYALVNERWRKTRATIISSFNPGEPEPGKKVVFEYSSEDRYNDPGRFVTHPNPSGRYVLLFGNKGRALYLFGQGASPEGNRPFIDEYTVRNGELKRLWRSEAPYYESPMDFLDLEKGLVLTSRQSQTEPPNYFIRNLKSGELTVITKFPHPYPQFKDIKKEMVTYTRDDGVQLSFELYLPADYTSDQGPLPTFLWAYPREYKSADAAGQISGSPYTFNRISPLSAIAMATQGYAILNNTSFPIIGEGDQEPNDRFVEQLVANAQAAIDKAVEMGVTDPDRVGVGGHSYGAFMTANLLSHSRLFAAGVARSGAYNRTLTPFGFQAEPRTYWQAPEIYYTMSPFMHADQVKDPILLIHGIADNNSGTFPIQSERYYAALKGHGATVRLVMLPHESHGYRARESLLHVLWETTKWLDTYVKNKGK